MCFNAIHENKILTKFLNLQYTMLAASQLPGRGPLMWMMPRHLHVDNTKNDYVMMMKVFLTLSRRTGVLFFLYPLYLYICLIFCGK